MFLSVCLLNIETWWGCSFEDTQIPTRLLVAGRKFLIGHPPQILDKKACQHPDGPTQSGTGKGTH